MPERVRVHARLRPRLPDRAVETNGTDVTFLTAATASDEDALSVVGTPDGVVTVSGASVAGVGDDDAKSGSKAFNFDSFIPADATQATVYDAVAAPVVRDVCDGYNGTLLAYGQTGTGKTFTMLGPEDSVRGGVQSPTAAGYDATKRGVIPRALDHIFTTAASLTGTASFEVSFSYVQVYCEIVTDLLAAAGEEGSASVALPGGGYAPMALGRPLVIREDPELGVFVDGATEVRVSDALQCLHYMELGAANRATAATLMNAHSSRSHAVCCVKVERRDAGSDGRVRVGRLYLVDLAGSERAKKSGVAGVRLSELRSINLSLSALGNCVAALAQKRGHVPYRDSKLTRLLQDSLGGNAKTALVVTVCGEPQHVGETLSTLRFGQRARKVEVRAVVNEHVDYKRLYLALRERLDREGDEATGLAITAQRLSAELGAVKDELEKERAERAAVEAELRCTGRGEGTESVDVLNRRWQAEVHSLREGHRKEVEELRRRNAAALLAQQEVAEVACAKRNQVEYDYSSSRDELLEALTDYRRCQERLAEVETALTERVGELMAELEASEARNEAKADEAAALGARVESAEAALRQVMDRVKSDFVSRTQVEEMEVLYEGAVQKLRVRVEVLEKGAAGGGQSQQLRGPGGVVSTVRQQRQASRERDGPAAAVVSRASGGFGRGPATRRFPTGALLK